MKTITLWTPEELAEWYDALDAWCQQRDMSVTEFLKMGIPPITRMTAYNWRKGRSCPSAAMQRRLGRMQTAYDSLTQVTRGEK